MEDAAKKIDKLKDLLSMGAISVDEAKRWLLGDDLPELPEDNVERSSFFVNNMSLKINQYDWPAQRQYLKWWLKQINGALMKTRKEIGKAIQIKVVGSIEENVLDNDIAKDQDLLIKIEQLSKDEVNKMIFKKLKAK